MKAIRERNSLNDLSEQTNNNLSRVCAFSILCEFGFDKRLQSMGIIFWRNELTAFVDVLLSESQVDPCIATTSLRLLQRYHVFLNRMLELSEIHQVVFTTFMIASKIVTPWARIDWASISAKVLEGQDIKWLEKEFLMDIRWEYDMLDVVEEVWDAYSEARRNNEEREDSTFLRRLSKTSSMTSEEGSRASPSLPTPLLRSPLKDNHRSRFSTDSSNASSSLRKAYKPDIPQDNDTGTLRRPRSHIDMRAPPRAQSRSNLNLRNRVSQIFRKE